MLAHRSLMALALVALLTSPSWSAPTSKGSAAPKSTPSSAPAPSVDWKLMFLFLNGKPVGAIPVVYRGEHPLAPVRAAEALGFKVDYTPNAQLATLSKSTGEVAVFKVGVPRTVVKHRSGAQSQLVMPAAPCILTSKRFPHATDHMWIPLETVVQMGGGTMTVEGRKIKVKL